MEVQVQPWLRSVDPTATSSRHVHFWKTQFSKPFKNPGISLSSNSHHTDKTSPPLSLKSVPHHFHLNPPRKSAKETTLLVEKRHVNHQLQSLTGKLRGGNLSPLQILGDDGDWSQTQFWAVIKFLQQNSSFEEIPEVFNAWIKLERSRISEFNYGKIIGLLSEAGMMEEALASLDEMKKCGLKLCSEVYNSVIHGYARKSEFDDALSYLREMEEIHISPDTETYDGLMRAYGKFQLYDEMVDCLKSMEIARCAADHITYNLLIRELSKGGLLGRMERIYQTLLTKKMDVQSSTLVAMLEAYAEFGAIQKMERFYMKVTNSKTTLEERLIRKIARVYIRNYMFSKLDDLGSYIAVRTGRTDLFWLLRLLSRASLSSKKGVSLVVREMEGAEVSWSITTANIISRCYLKMRDFERLNVTLLEFPRRNVKPDIFTLGILYDAHDVGFDWSSTLKTWRKYGYLEKAVEMNTDSLVFAAFGKGLFLGYIEEMYSLLDPRIREEREWTYGSLLDFVLKHSGSCANAQI